MIPPRLWVYTNFDCNLRCSYCLSSSHPGAPRRAFPLPAFRPLIEEAAEAGIAEAFLTGGEPFLLPDIHQYLEAALSRMPVTVLTNGLLLTGQRLQRLLPLRELPLTLQLSLDGHLAELHDAYRGAGTWRPTVRAVQRLIARGFHVTIGATETPANSGAMADLAAFVTSLGVGADGFLARPLSRRGLSQEGVELAPTDMVPELTVTAEGVYWHPQSGGETFLLSKAIFPLRHALDVMEATYQAVLAGRSTPQQYRCA